MRLIPTRPTTIESVRYGERWFPRVLRHTDGSLLLYIEYGHDSHFSPDFRLQSHDNGNSWHTPTDNVPRACFAHSFADGELLEIDSYGIHDPKTESMSALFGAWSDPGNPGTPVKKSLIKVHGPSLKKTPLMSQRGYPTFHWWPLWNGLHGTDQLKAEDIHLLGPYFTSGVRLADGRLIAMGYWSHRDLAIEKSCVFCFESSDRGLNWREISLVANDDTKPEGANEATVVQLRDGRLYVIARTGASLVQTWSSDLGRTWTPLTEVKLVDEPSHQVGLVWPVMTQLEDGSLVLVYGRPGKNIVIDPSGTGTQWQARLDLHAWELETQAIMGVPAKQRLDNSHGMGVRYWNSGDYLFVVTDGPRGLLVGYDVQHFYESWNAKPMSGVRMLRVTVE